ncbi:MAG: response regulator [Chitinophagales bacterium]|nr:response regulator [Chitinophagales bacterium]
MRKKIMVIDDQMSMRKLLSHFLGQYYEVNEQPSATAALNAINQGAQPDIIISDVIMPEMTGTEFLRNYQERFQEAIKPVIILSTIENSSEKMKCFHYGAADYVLKPFNPEELLVRVKNALRN